MQISLELPLGRYSMITTGFNKNVMVYVYISDIK